MAEVGEASQNGYAERLLRTIKEEEVDLSEYEDYTDAVRQLGRFLDEVYMHKRIHSSPGYLSPSESEDQWRGAPKHRFWMFTKNRPDRVQFLGRTSPFGGNVTVLGLCDSTCKEA